MIKEQRSCFEEPAGVSMKGGVRDGGLREGDDRDEIMFWDGDGGEKCDGSDVVEKVETGDEVAEVTWLVQGVRKEDRRTQSFKKATLNKYHSRITVHFGSFNPETAKNK